jgi:autotransporter-associated beta strand protein
MSRNSRRSQRRAVSVQRTRQKTWLRRYLRTLQGGVAAASIGAVSLLAQPAFAANDVWQGNTDVNWATATNWNAGAGPAPAIGDSLEFGAAGTKGAALTDNLTTGVGVFNLSGITFDAGAPAYTITAATTGTPGFTLTGGGLTNNSSSLQTITSPIGFTGSNTITPGTNNVVLSGNIAIGGTVAGGAAGAGTSGAVYQSSGIVSTYPGTTPQGGNTARFQIGAANNAYGYYQLSGTGTLNTTQLSIGGGNATNNGAVGVFDMTGGTLTTTSTINIGRGDAGGVLQSTGQTAVFNITGGTVNTLAGFTGATASELDINWGGINALTVVNISNGTLATGNTTSNARVRIGFDTGTNATAVVNLNAGGNLLTNRFRQVDEPGVTGFLNFNGGTLKALAASGGGQQFLSESNGNYSTGGLEVFVFPGGATIDNGGFKLIGGANLQAPLYAPTGSGVSTITLNGDQGSGYIGAPAVTINGVGSGATAVANMVPDGAGKLKIGSITVTSAGVDYASIPSITLSGGGTVTPANPGNWTVTTADNTSGPQGGLSLIGTGITEFSGTSTFKGVTTVSGGATLQFADPGTFTASPITLGTTGGGGTVGKLIQNSTTALAPTVTVANGSIAVNGSRTVNSVIVGDLSTNSLTSSNLTGVVNNGLLTVGSLTFNGAAAVNLTTSPPTAGVNSSPAMVVTSSLSANTGSGPVTINLTNTDGGWANGVYYLISHTSGAIGGTGGFGAFQKNITIGARQSADLLDDGLNGVPANTIYVKVSGNSAVWSGALGNGVTPGNWTVSGQAAPHNWNLSSSPFAQTDYFENATIGDSVIFGDVGADGATPVSTGLVNISDANVKPAIMSFPGNSVNYTISGSSNGSGGTWGIVGVGALVKTGSSTLTLNTANTYSGGTIIRGGTLNLNVPDASTTATQSAIGTGPLTIGLNTTVNNTSGGAVTLRTNNAQTWNGDWTYAGSADLNMGTGAVTVNANGTQVTQQGGTSITVGTSPATAKTLTVGGPITMTGSTNGLIKNGPGTLVLANTGTTALSPSVIGSVAPGANSASTSGQTRVLAGTLKITGGFLTLGGSRPSLAIGFFAAGQNGSATANQGTVIMTGGTLTVNEEMWLGSQAGTYGSFSLQGGTVNETGILAIARTQPDSGAAPAGIGVVNVGGNATTAAAFNVTGGDIAAGSYGQGGAASGAAALINVLPNGTITTNPGIVVGGGSFPGFLNVSGDGTAAGKNGQFTVSTGGTGEGLTVAAGGTNAAGGSTANLGAVGSTGAGTNKNGQITTPFVTGGNAANTSFNFHGGTLQANVNNQTLMSSNNDANFRTYIWNEGGVIDSNGQSVTISQILRSPSGTGVTAGTLAVDTSSAVGYTDTPFVRITNAASDTTGYGATAVATFNYTTGQMAIVMTNPGVNYTAVPTFTLVGGGGTGATITGAAALNAGNVGGQLIKTGAGTLALSGANLYDGGTLLTGGTTGTTPTVSTLAINSPTALGAATGTLTINGANVALDSTAAAAVVMTNANPIDWQTDMAWSGTQALTTIGPVTLDRVSGNTTDTARTITTAGAQVLTIGGVISNGSTGGAVNSLTVKGTGTVALSGANAFTGSVTVNAGTLQLTGAGSVETATGGITVNGATAKLVQLSSQTISAHPVTLTQGTVDGTTTIGTVNVADNLNANIASGNGTATPLTITNLNFQGKGTMNFVLSPASKTQAKLVVGALNTNIAAANASTPGLVVVKASNTDGFWTFGDVYQLINYTSINTNLVVPALSALSSTPASFQSMGGRQTATLNDDTMGHISLSIGGFRIVWTGQSTSDWLTGVQAQHNWKQSEAPFTPDDYIVSNFNGTLIGDAVNFDDSAGPGHTTVNITGADVSPASIFFNNTAGGQPYSFTGTKGIAGISSVLSNGNGSITFATPNRYSGGTFLNNGGTLGINSPTAIGTGALTLGTTANPVGGNLDNSSGSDITMVTAPGGATPATNAQFWNGDVTYLASTNNALNMGTGRVTIAGNGPTRTVTINNNTLTTGRITVGTATANQNLIKAGPGTWNTGNGGGGGSTVNGNLTISDGTLRLGVGAAASSLTATGALSGSSTAIIENGSASAQATLTETNDTNVSFDGILRDGAGSNGGGRLGFVKNGIGTLTLNGVNTFSNGLTVNGGRLVLAGGNQPTATPVGGFGQINIASTAGNNAIVTLPNTTLNAPKTTAPAVQIGGAANSAGALRMNNDQFHGMATNSELWLGTQDGNYGVMDMTGGSVTVASWFALGRGGGQGVLNMTGGTINMNNSAPASGALTNGSFGGAGGVVHGLMNISGGTFTAGGDAGAAPQLNTAPFFAGDRGSAFAGEGANSVTDVSGTGTLQATGITGTLRLGRGGGVTGIVNALTGGTIQAIHVTQGQGTGIFNFNGGTLKAFGADTQANPFFGVTNYHQGDPSWTGTQGTLNVYAYPAGGIIDCDGDGHFVNVPILAPAGNGVSLSGITVSGGGFIGTPVVQITRGAGDTTGAGASALAVIDSNGNLTGLQLTSPGTGYTVPPVVTLSGGGIGNTGLLNGAASATALIVPNISGGITFADSIGGGVTVMNAVNTYKGPTTVQSGQLALGVSGAVASSSRLVMAGGTLRSDGVNQSMPTTKLDVTAESHLFLSAETYIFADSSTLHWTNPNSIYNPGNNAVLHIDNYTSPTTQKIQFPTATSLTPNQLAQITFNGSDHGSLVADGGMFDLVPSTAALPALLRNGDVDHNNTVDGGDIGRLLTAVTNVNSYINTYLPSTQGGVPAGYTLASEAYTLADVGGGGNGAGDGSIDNLDMQALISYLASGGNGFNAPGGGSLAAAVPEPGTFVLMIIGGALIAGGSVYRRRQSAHQEVSEETGTASD